MIDSTNLGTIERFRRTALHLLDIAECAAEDLEATGTPDPDGTIAHYLRKAVAGVDVSGVLAPLPKPATIAGTSLCRRIERVVAFQDARTAIRIIQSDDGSVVEAWLVLDDEPVRQLDEVEVEPYIDRLAAASRVRTSRP